jgi:tRNA 2-selenouridine synthase
LYKALSQVFEQSYNWLTLGGKTGTGKTAVLNYLKKLGTPVLNLEALAESKGSVFDEVESALSQEQFEINLALAIVALNSQSLCLIEREGSKIGGVFLPASLHSTLQKAKCIWLKRPVEDRLTQVLKDFGDISSLNLQKGLVKLASALGEEAFKKIDKLAEELFKYYDEQPGYQKPVKVLKEIRVTKPAETARKIQAVLASIKEVG